MLIEKCYAEFDLALFSSCISMICSNLLLNATEKKISFNSQFVICFPLHVITSLLVGYKHYNLTRIFFFNIF